MLGIHIIHRLFHPLLWGVQHNSHLSSSYHIAWVSFFFSSGLRFTILLSFAFFYGIFRKIGEKVTGDTGGIGQVGEIGVLASCD